jgi:putative transposase
MADRWRTKARSNSLEADFCVQALKTAIVKYGKPAIKNGDQGSQFTGFEWPQALKDADIKISMDAKCRWVDNRMIERLWRSLKYECIYLNAFETGSQTRTGIGKWLAYDNAERPHSTHGILTPDEAHDRKTEPMRSAA